MLSGKLRWPPVVLLLRKNSALQNGKEIESSKK